MLLGEFYKGKDLSNEQIIEHFYTSTLSAWLIFNDFEVFENVLDHFQRQEDYLVCEGISRALAKIEAIMDERFSEASEEVEEGVFQYEYKNHKAVSKRIFEDVMTEIYERKTGNA